LEEIMAIGPVRHIISSCERALNNRMKRMGFEGTLPSRMQAIMPHYMRFLDEGMILNGNQEMESEEEKTYDISSFLKYSERANSCIKKIASRMDGYGLNPEIFIKEKLIPMLDHHPGLVADDNIESFEAISHLIIKVAVNAGTPSSLIRDGIHELLNEHKHLATAEYGLVFRAFISMGNMISNTTDPMAIPDKSDSWWFEDDRWAMMKPYRKMNPRDFYVKHLIPFLRDKNNKLITRSRQMTIINKLTQLIAACLEPKGKNKLANIVSPGEVLTKMEKLRFLMKERFNKEVTLIEGVDFVLKFFSAGMNASKELDDFLYVLEGGLVEEAESIKILYDLCVFSLNKGIGVLKVVSLFKTLAKANPGDIMIRTG
jgi:hypothetical protein